MRAPRTDFELGSFEAAVLGGVVAAGDDAYGVSIGEAVENIIGREPSSGALYTTLNRLVEKGLLVVKESPPTAARGGRRKFNYEITGAGRNSLDGYLTRSKRLGDLLWGRA